MRIQVDSDIALRSVEPSDAEALFGVVDANRAHLEPWLPWVEHTRTPADTLEFIEKSIEQEVQKTGLAAIIESDAEIYGVLGLNTIDLANQTSEIGYWLRADLEGRGIMTRSVASIVDYAFATLGLNRLGIRAEPENQRSRAIAERLGFHEEGVLREIENYNGRFVDLVSYSLLRREHTAS
jgi:ribosomal-protein-serine acetyltransferase